MKARGKLSGGNKNQPSKFERYNFHRSFAICVGSPSPVNGDCRRDRREKKRRESRERGIEHFFSNTFARGVRVHVCALHSTLSFRVIVVRRTKPPQPTILGDKAGKSQFKPFPRRERTKGCRSSQRGNQSLIRFIGHASSLSQERRINYARGARITIELFSDVKFP